MSQPTRLIIHNLYWQTLPILWSEAQDHKWLKSPWVKPRVCIPRSEWGNFLFDTENRMIFDGELLGEVQLHYNTYEANTYEAFMWR